MLSLDRRRFGIVLAVVASLVLIALAARSDHADPGTGAWSLSSTATGALQVTVLILFLLLGFGVLALAVWGMRPDGVALTPPKRRSWWNIVGSVMGMVLVLVLFSQARGSGGDEDAPPGREPGLPLGAPVPTTDADDGRDPEWGLGVLGVVLLLGAAGVVAFRRRLVPLDLPDDPRPVATKEERYDAVATAESCTDPRQAVLLAFAAAESVLSADPTTRRPPATSAREWATAMEIAPLRDIVGRYEVARFSLHDVTEHDRAVALGALRSLA